MTRELFLPRPGLMLQYFAPTPPFPLPRTMRRGRVLFPSTELGTQREVEGIETDMSIAKGRMQRMKAEMLGKYANTNH